MSDSERIPLASLKTMAELRARPIACPKGPSRAEVKASKDRSGDTAWEKCKAIVWKRDEGKCRRCGRVVIKTIEMVPQRGEVHHVARRATTPKALLTDDRNCMLVCLLPCHEGLTHYTLGITGKASEMFVYAGKSYLDATFETLQFVELKEPK